MKILAINGSPTKNGNTAAALDMALTGIFVNLPSVDVELLQSRDFTIAPCNACMSCQGNGGNCTHEDDAELILQKLIAADAIVFATPVYWMGVSSQLKLILDRMFAKLGLLAGNNKKIAVISVGGYFSRENPQYALITSQFENICKLLGWTLAFSEGFYAAKRGELATNDTARETLSEVWKKLL